jgi:hypothetical protein
MTGRLDALLREMRREFPRLRLLRKDRVPSQRLVHHVLRVLTLGGQRTYLTDYVTTIGQTIYVTPDWEELAEDERVCVLRHEREHMRQFRRYTFLGMAIAYLLLPLPLGLAYCRARLEWQGYAETIRAHAELHGAARVREPSFRAHIIAQFTTGAYGWMWPFPGRVGQWYDEVVATCRETP